MMKMIRNIVMLLINTYKLEKRYLLSDMIGVNSPIGEDDCIITSLE